jgi:wyosine [tRNA(Phe)-imidazoG37] synthetase (radical SAM superfamily)
MFKLKDRMPFLHELLFPYGGNWGLCWVAHRYFRTIWSGVTKRKLVNAAIAFKEMRFGRIQVKSKPLVLRIEPTNLCNLRCPFCVCGAKRDSRPKGFMSIEHYKQILEDNKETAMLVRLDGMGEPTLHKRIFEMIKMAKSYGYSVSMSTNFNTDICAKVEGFLDSGIDRLIVCIDGNTQASYEKYRVGGDLALVRERLVSLTRARKSYVNKGPFIEVQFIDLGYNHNEIPAMRRLVRQWGADKLQVVSPELSTQEATQKGHVNPSKPRRCYWLWSVLTVGWDLDYHACTNSWSLPWPRLNMQEVPSDEFWNHQLMLEARQYNINKSSECIASDSGCKCSRCVDMLCEELAGHYWCE